MPAVSTIPSPKRRTGPLLMVLCAVLTAGCQTAPEISMPEVRGKSCAYYAAKIAELQGLVAAKEVEAQAETAGFFAASVALSLVVPFAGLATIPAEQEAKKDTWQAQSDLWSFKVAFEARDCQ